VAKSVATFLNDMNEPKIEDTTKFADAFYSGVQIVAEHMKEHSGKIESVFCKPETGHRDAAIKGLWFRARAWMQSLEALNHTKHVQAISVANRALLEITVDLILLHHDKTNGLGWKIYQFGMSERMRAAEQLVGFYKDEGRPVPNVHWQIEEYFNREKGLTDDMRRRLWPNKKNPAKAAHPSRWTGNSDLSVDVKQADKLFGAEIQKQLGCGLLEYYRTRYRQMNWLIHSGVASFWNLPPQSFDISAAFALKDCADLAFLCTKIALTDFGFNVALPNLPQEWDDLAEKRAQAYLDKMLSTEKE
jgi:hypothetical protein